ncbi:MAG TPA: AAA family ATPase [Syntrophorhabdaceae bacterium]|nr:AAA family ATPase [Syntrophorhabdaceae bacterium]
MDIPYLEFFGLSEKPFGMSPDPDFYFESTEHKQAFDYLTFFIAEQEGFALIYGDVGSGKTTISRIFLNSLDKNKYNTALILNPVTDEVEFMKEVLNEFGRKSEQNSKKELYDTLRMFLLDQFQQARENILIIDEAQLLSYEMLEFIRLLSNIETDKQKILHTIFFAQPEFLSKLKEERMRHLAQRITVTYGIRPLSYNEVKSYINYRLFKAGSKGPLTFEEKAIKMIHAASMGYPRLVNYICDRCLLVLYGNSTHAVNSHAVSRVLAEENIPLKSVKSTLPFLPGKQLSAAVTISLLIILFFAAYVFFPSFRTLFAQKERRPSVSYQNIDSTTKKTETGKTPEKKISITVSTANVRSEPSIDSSRIGAIARGEVLTVLEEKNSNDDRLWYKIILHGDRPGWISSAVVAPKR